MRSYYFIFDPADEFIECPSLGFHAYEERVGKNFELKRSSLSYSVEGLKEFLRIMYDMTHGQHIDLRAWCLGSQTISLLPNRSAMSSLNKALEGIKPVDSLALHIDSSLQNMFGNEFRFGGGCFTLFFFALPWCVYIMCLCSQKLYATADF